MSVCKQLGIIVVWHHPPLHYKVSKGSGATRLCTIDEFLSIISKSLHHLSIDFINYIAIGSQTNYIVL